MKPYAQLDKQLQEPVVLSVKLFKVLRLRAHCILNIYYRPAKKLN